MENWLKSKFPKTNWETSSPIRIIGFRRGALPVLFNHLGFKAGAEIGVCQGAYSKCLCDSIPELSLFCIDSWAPYEPFIRKRSQEVQDRNFSMAKELLAGFKTTFIKKYSMEAAKEIPDGSLDFVYIDGNHRYGFVKEDLWEWGKKVRVGGVMSGHDYYEFRSGNKGVVTAVNEYVAAHKIERWFITDERTPSFFWRKA